MISRTLPSSDRWPVWRPQPGQHFQYQVLIKPSPDGIQEPIWLHWRRWGSRPPTTTSVSSNNWESPTLGAWGVGWEVWLDGMEVTRFPYFQQCGGIDCKPVSIEITYGLERLAMYLQDVDNIWDLSWNSERSYGQSGCRLKRGGVTSTKPPTRSGSSSCLPSTRRKPPTSLKRCRHRRWICPEVQSHLQPSGGPWRDFVTERGHHRPHSQPGPQGGRGLVGRTGGPRFPAAEGGTLETAA